MATKHEKVYNYIERLILEGTIAKGEPLPGEVELSKSLEVSRNTIRHAFAELGRKYRVERTPGKGSLYMGTFDEAPDTRAIGIINSSLMYNIYPELIHGIEDGLYRGGYSMILANGNYDPEKERESIRRMLKQHVAGLIIEPMVSAIDGPEGQLIRELNRAGIPIITTNCMIEGLKASYITLDDFHIGELAARHFLDRGHRHLGVVYKRDNQASVLRFQGFCREAARAGVMVPDKAVASYIQEDEPLVPGAWCTGKILESSHPVPQGIFYFNDQIALQAYEYLKGEGISVPDRLSVIGVDNIPEAAHMSPGLTTFNHPKYLMGKLAAEMMLARLGPHNDALSYGVVMRPEIVLRESVGDR